MQDRSHAKPQRVPRHGVAERKLDREGIKERIHNPSRILQEWQMGEPLKWIS
jgi:hypothetical protein